MRQGVLEQLKEAKRIKDYARVEHLQKKMSEIEHRLRILVAELRKMERLYIEYRNRDDPRTWAAQEVSYEIRQEHAKYSRMLYG